MKYLCFLVMTMSVLIDICTANELVVHPFEIEAELTPATAIDIAVLNRLKQLEIKPARICSDSVFLRRAYLDVIGTLPTVRESNQFLRDTNPEKRGTLIDQLLEREEFATYQSMKWSDLLRIKSEFPINLWPNAAQTYHHWIYESIRQNKPYDRLAYEMITASGSNFRTSPVNFYRAIQSKEPAAIVRAVALTFMGSRTESWKQEQIDGMLPFFSYIGFKSTKEWKEEIVFFDSVKATTNSLKNAVFPDGTPVQLSAKRDPREDFANWLINRENPWFARNIVNRICYWLLGRGIIHEPDDIRSDNPPENPELLALLEKELVDSNYDLKHIYRTILNSKTYQLSFIPADDNPDAVSNFACHPLRRLDAEVLIDALCQLTGTKESYSSKIPEPFTFIPDDQRSIALPDGSITSPFLDMFGRPSRDTGLSSERNGDPSSEQLLHMRNSSHVWTKLIKSGRIRNLLRPKKKRNASGNRMRGTVSNIYLTVLSRKPTDRESAILRAYMQSDETSGRDALLDLIWALINSAEFLYQH